MKSLRWLTLAALALPVLASAQGPRVEKLSDHTYAYLTGPSRYNSSFIVTDEGVIVVDTQDTVNHAEELIAEIKKISTKPIIYAVNTNFHYMHATGNQLLVKDAKAIISHENARKNMSELGQEELTNVKQQYALTVEQLEKSLRDDPLTDQERAATDAALVDAKKSLTGLDRTQLTLPNLTLTPGSLHFYPDSLPKHDVLYTASGTNADLTNVTLNYKVGGVEFQVLYLGRGYTDGDVLVYVPAEKVLICGGMLFAQTIPWLRNSYISEWNSTLEHILRLDAEKVVPGTGEIATRDDLIAFKGYLTDLYTAVKNLVDQGVPRDDLRWKVDLSAYQNWADYESNLRYNIEDAYDQVAAARKAGG